MKSLFFASRTAKEILRDPLNLGFGLGFPLVLLLLLSAIQANIPVPLFEIETLTPGITVFGRSFMTLFSATLVARDRESAFLERLYTTPLTASDFILTLFWPIFCPVFRSPCCKASSVMPQLFCWDWHPISASYTRLYCSSQPLSFSSHSGFCAAAFSA